MLGSVGRAVVVVIGTTAVVSAITVCQSRYTSFIGTTWQWQCGAANQALNEPSVTQFYERVMGSVLRASRCERRVRGNKCLH